MHGNSRSNWNIFDNLLILTTVVYEFQLWYHILNCKIVQLFGNLLILFIDYYELKLRYLTLKFIFYKRYITLIFIVQLTNTWPFVYFSLHKFKLQFPLLNYIIYEKDTPHSFSPFVAFYYKSPIISTDNPKNVPVCVGRTPDPLNFVYALLIIPFERDEIVGRPRWCILGYLSLQFRFSLGTPNADNYETAIPLACTAFNLNNPMNKFARPYSPLQWQRAVWWSLAFSLCGIRRRTFLGQSLNVI